MSSEIEQDHDYRFAPVLEPEPEAPEVIPQDAPPVQTDIVVVAETPAESEHSKKALRAEVLAKRDALSEKERRAAERRINEKLFQHPDVHRAKTVLLYASDGHEVATDDLAKELMKRGKAVAYPKITNVAGLMTLWRVRSLDALIPHKHGIRAPDVTRSSPTEPLNIDCVIYPGLAFTKGLARLGRGGGYYDRLSAKLADNCARIGICYEAQITDQLPQETHDAKMHWVVTELTVYPYVPDPPVIQAPPASGENVKAEIAGAPEQTEPPGSASPMVANDSQATQLP
ncbi:MAG: 5-formyltetrahydrofolate cyclo-ligase [Burkholderiales bacterium]|nr:MAG: 5-formyltetrahydrofolate cyclo-ligase [Burkholderiales bacterium]